MIEQVTREREREEMEMLLPWYVTGTLDRADQARVESYLANHPEMSFQLDLIRAEREQTVSANETLGAPSAGALDRLMSSLPAQRQSLAQRASRSGLFERIAEFFAAPSARGVRYATVAAALLVAVQAAAIATLLTRDGGNGFQAASGKTTAAGGVTALVVFADEARAPAIAQILSEFNATIVDGPKAGGVYKVRLRTVEQREQDAVLRRLAERRDIVKLVLPSRD